MVVARYYPKRRKAEHLSDKFSQEILRLKHFREPATIKRLAHRLSYTAKEWLSSKIDQITLLTYPPSSRKKRYYFVRELAQNVSAELDIEPVELLFWKEKVSSKGNRVLSLKERLGKKIGVKPQFEKVVEGKSILLIDDILTTGLTALAAVKALREDKAAEVYVACLGWTMDTDNYSQKTTLLNPLGR